jgi:hypothetical protein
MSRKVSISGKGIMLLIIFGGGKQSRILLYLLFGVSNGITSASIQ